jgi:hypothetical protein
MVKFWLTALVLAGLSLEGSLLAQDPESVQVDHKRGALAKAISFYDRELDRNTMLYTGISYYDPHSTIKGHQFFGDDYWEQGSIDYNGQHYDSIYVKYDIFKDQLLVENFNSNGFLSPIILDRTKVNSFDLREHHFMKIEADTTSILRTGYYDLMYQGNELQFVVHRRKEIVDSNEISTIREEFAIKDRYYIKKGDDYYRFRNKNSLLKILKDHKKELKAFIKRSGMQTTMQPDVLFTRIIKYYDSIL